MKGVLTRWRARVSYLGRCSFGHSAEQGDKAVSFLDAAARKNLVEQEMDAWNPWLDAGVWCVAGCCVSMVAGQAELFSRSLTG